MKLFNRFFAILAATALLAGAANVSAQEAPDALVKRISQEIVDIAKADKEIQSGNQKRVLELVEAKVLPFVNFEHMTSLAAGRFWREATPSQQKALIAEFRTLLVYTYSGAIAQVKDQTLEFRPMTGDPTDTDVVVRSQVTRSRGEPIQLFYRLEKLPGGWKIYDVNVLGAWLVETYKGNFAAEIGRGGIDGLVKALSEKNKQLAAKALSSGK
jgi:phospholipid transport system substrate-binding protein